LCTLIDVGLVQNVSKLVKHEHGDGGLHFLQMLSNFTAKPNGNLHTIVGRLIQQQNQNLTGEILVLYLLIDEMGEECGRREANGLVVSLEALAELHDEPLDEQLTNLGKLRIHDRSHGGINGCEWQTRSLGLHD
jgi:hypothetical protein